MAEASLLPSYSVPMTNQKRTKVKAADKRKLITEAGGKCANPGCPNVLVEIHHIREWHIYRTHDPEHMIAICPACHDAVDRGDLKITDEDAYSWKRIVRQAASRGHLYVEPGDVPPTLLLGSIAAQAESGDLVVFSQREDSQLSFKIAGLDIMQVNAIICGVDERPLVRVDDGHFQLIPGSQANLSQRPGRFRVTHPQDGSVLPEWALEQIRTHEAGFAAGPSVRILDMHVLEPNTVRVQGIWMKGEQGIVITKKSLIFLEQGQVGPISFSGAGLDTVLRFNGPAEAALFGIAEKGSLPPLELRI